MDTLPELLTSTTAPWWAVPAAMAIGLLLGALAVRIGTRRPRSVDIASWQPELREIYVRYLGAADAVHNSFVEVDQAVLADSDLEKALASEDPILRTLAEGIVDLDGMVNELRILAPTAVLDPAGALFDFLTAQVADGTDDIDGFRAAYRTGKAKLVDAVRVTFGS
ncbi:hypothetical protein ERC79_19615 [Rhodococcus sp. ABRD24]|uniref:hypothetical protein n=1 Tax=Rhodococcus sp. ABRD24 TaxID=2507582 RepID=UPI00104053E4|nr:hypothetical protein [Rhodococcus sp. ABRD24]QBJ97905.1 hypothetical protein ERC79_19615 [Rhodococcus sp. ABRD24]